MNYIKSIFIVLTFFFITSSCEDQPKQAVTELDAEMLAANKASEIAAVTQVMKSYKDAIQNLTTDGTFELFTPDAKVFEQGKIEGTYKDYIDHHLGPELGHFESFTFSNYKIDVSLSLPYAFTTETYNYTIVLKGDEAKGVKPRTIESIGVGTTVLEKMEGTWKIINSHTSFKKIKQ